MEGLGRVYPPPGERFPDGRSCLAFGLPLPNGLLRLFETVDGIELGDMGPEYLRFWTIDEVLGSMVFDAASECVVLDFADYLIHSEVFSVRVDRSGGSIVVNGDDLVARSFDDFMAAYVGDPGSVIVSYGLRAMTSRDTQVEDSLRQALVGRSSSDGLAQLRRETGA